MSKHFHVLVGMCGLYMPDENHVYRTRREAQDGARSLATQFRDEGEHVSGSARTGRYAVGENYCIEVTDCDEPECLRDIE